MITHSIQTTEYNIETRQYQGKDHLVVPVVMMVEGVHSGSQGAILWTEEELRNSAEDWNGVPVVISHPEDADGNFISANSPSVHPVGTIFNARMEGDKLKAEVWLDAQMLIAVSPLASAYINEGRHLEVSIGAYTETEEIVGNYNNEEYQGIAHNPRPDHLALLPGEQGACSWTDGCGIRVNKQLKSKANEMKEATILALKELSQEGFAVRLIDNGQGYQEQMGKIQTKLDSMDNDQAVYYLEEMYDGYFVYRRRSRTEGESTLHQQNYSVGEDDSIEFSGEPLRVRREVNYIQANKMVRTKEKKGDKKMVENTKPCCPDKVDALIANKHSNFTEDDKEWLLTQDAATLEKMIPKEQKPVEPQVNTADYVRKDSLKTTDDFIALAPKEMQDQMRSGLALHQEHRTSLIASIIANAKKDSWTEAELQELDAKMLVKLNSQFEEVSDYSLQGSGTVPNTNLGNDELEEPMLPTGMGVKKEDK
jgi:hypothetical protein